MCYGYEQETEDLREEILEGQEDWARFDEEGWYYADE